MLVFPRAFRYPSESPSSYAIQFSPRINLINPVGEQARTSTRVQKLNSNEPFVFFLLRELPFVGAISFIPGPSEATEGCRTAAFGNSVEGGWGKGEEGGGEGRGGREEGGGRVGDGEEG